MLSPHRRIAVESPMNRLPTMRVLLAVLDRDAITIVREAVGDDARVKTVPAPQSVVVPLGDVRDERVAAERGLHPVGRRETEIVRVEHVVVRAALAGVHGVVAGPEKEPVAAVRRRIERDDVVVALLVHQDARRVLASTVEAVAVAAHVEVDDVADDRVVARAVQPDAEPGVEREVVVPDRHVIDAIHQQRVHALRDRVPRDEPAAHVVQVDRGAEAQPLVRFVVVKREPVDEALVLDEAEEPGLPVVAEIGIADLDVASAAHEDAHFEAANACPDDADVPSSVDANRDAFAPGPGPPSATCPRAVRR